MSVPPPALTPLDSSAPSPQRQQPSAQPNGALAGPTVQSTLANMDASIQHFLDRIAPFKLYRWIFLVCLLSIFMIRMFFLQGFYIVTYVLFIYILNQFILFLQPKDRASLIAKARAAALGTSTESAEAEESTDAQLPTMDDEEFRPFVRRLPEFKFWYSTSYATCLAFFATFFKALDVPVFWPVLLFYFVVLFFTTMRRQWMDMKALKYVPWDIGSKKVYKSDPKKLSVTKQGPVDVVAASGRVADARPVPTVNVVTKKPNIPSPPPHSQQEVQAQG